MSPDDRTLRFTSLGLATGGALSIEAAAEFQQRAVAGRDLAPNVSEGTRKSFERLRSLHSYGVLFYDAFTIAAGMSWLVLEQALRERFIEFYGGVVPIRDARSGVPVPLLATDFACVDAAFRKGGPHQKGKWELSLSNGGAIGFRASMRDLYRWARAEQLLDGQRSAALDSIFIQSRNGVAHSHYRLSTPVESALAVSDLAETVNRLWGHRTPGGRLYPAPIPREVMVVAWDENHAGGLTRFRAEQLVEFIEPGEWTCLILRAAQEDRGLWEFDAQFERTHYPADLLWGPGPTAAGLSWLERTQPQMDAAEYLDRLFALQVRGTDVSLPRRPEVALGLTGGERSGRWYLIRADHPDDALALARRLPSDPATTATQDDAHTSELLLDGTWDELASVLPATYGVLDPARPPVTQVPRPRG